MARVKYLKPTKPNAKVKHFGTFDIETSRIDVEGKIRTLFIGFYINSKFYSFRTYKDFLTFVLKLHKRGKGTTILYAHNGGNFDFLPLLEEFWKRNIKPRMTVIHGSVAEIKTGNYLVFRDSSKLLPGSLKQLAKSFEADTQKGFIDFEKEEFNPDNPEHVEYNRRDCVALHQVLKRFYSQDYVCDSKKKLTTAGTAMQVFRTHFLPSPIPVTDQETQDFCRRSYFGGRVEIFRRESFDLKCFDINSLYPFCMKKRLPISYICPSRDPFDFGFHDVTIEIPRMFIPPLPLKFKMEKSEKLIFPTGIIRGVFFSEEIKHAVELGAKILKFHEGKFFSDSTELFSDYVDVFYKMRKEFKGKSQDATAKLLLNSLYGKTGMREKQKQFTFYDGSQTDFREWDRFEELGLIELETSKREPFMLVHIASAVTAYGRITLSKTMLQPYQDKLFYCDTDSGYVDGKTFIKTGSELGEWKLENEYSYGYFRAPKTYYCEEKDTEKKHIRAKGFKNFLLKNINKDEFKLTDLKRAYIAPFKLKSSLKRNKEFFSSGIYSKSLISVYDKRAIDGNSTRPWHITKEGVIK